MKFIKTASAQPAAEHLARVIGAALQNGKRVLWLLSGGSAVAVAVTARNLLKHTAGLTVMLVDERFVGVHDPNSNWQKLSDAGFDFSGTANVPILQGDASIEHTAADYEKALALVLDQADFRVGLFGIGADGHTAGILPGSPAVDSKKLVAHFKGPDFERVTITANAIKQLDAAVAYAVGNEKTDTLRNLRQNLSVAKQPAQILKQVKQTYIYNDYIGETEE